MGRFTYNLLYLLAILKKKSPQSGFQEEDPTNTARMSGYMGCSRRHAMGRRCIYSS